MRNPITIPKKQGAGERVKRKKWLIDWGDCQLIGMEKAEENDVHSPDKDWSLSRGHDVWSHGKFDIGKLQAVIKDGVCFLSQRQ